MTTLTAPRPAHPCGHCRHHITADQPADRLGFGYSRDTEPDPAPVPDGVELIFLTGRTPRSTR